jgi:DNA polymerase III epsilon subunit-like protein
LDLETTGLSPTDDRIVEVGAVLYDTTRDKVLAVMSRLVQCEIAPYVGTGLTPDDLIEFGLPIEAVLEELQALCCKAERLVGHNGRSFDARFLRAEAGRLGITAAAFLDLPWYDTYRDLPVLKAGTLGVMAEMHGIQHGWGHRALFDAMTSLRLLARYPTVIG